MRDIRGDLQDRANLITKQISADQAQFEKLVEQLKLEHQSRLKNPVTELEAVRLLIDFEHRRLTNATPHPPIPQSLSTPQGMSRLRPMVKLAS
jgi:hypothetical protein